MGQSLQAQMNDTGKTKQEYAQSNLPQAERLQADLDARVEQVRQAKLADCAPSCVEGE